MILWSPNATVLKNPQKSAIYGSQSQMLTFKKNFVGNFLRKHISISPFFPFSSTVRDAPKRYIYYWQSVGMARHGKSKQQQHHQDSAITIHPYLTISQISLTFSRSFIIGRQASSKCWGLNRPKLSQILTERWTIKLQTSGTTQVKKIP